MSLPSHKELLQYRRELDRELDLILRYWAGCVPDGRGRFYGSLNNRNVPLKGAPIGIVMVSRILWTFSAAALMGKMGYETILATAYRLIAEDFTDREHGGVYWSIRNNGFKETKKQIYGLAFCIYGLSEYYKLCGEQEVLDRAIELYRLIEKYGSDGSGYIEALSRDWKEMDDLRLSAKDMNTKKSMNTHLHVVEAYANLYSVWSDADLKQNIEDLLILFDEKIIDHTTGHMHLFMDVDWEVRSGQWSFGHDIEAAWLLLECAQLINAPELELFTENAFRLAGAASEGIDGDGGMFYEYDVNESLLLKEKHWWPQAEAMVGFFRLWQLSGDHSWLKKSMNTWRFVKARLKDPEHGEWFWGIDESGAVMNKEKAGFWKCPYHNGRACMEIIKSISQQVLPEI